MLPEHRNVILCRRGTAYVIVLSISMLVTVIGVAALSAVRVQVRSATVTCDAEDARLAAQSGIDLARVWISRASDWRTNAAKGAWDTPITLNGGTLQVNITDPSDGDLTNSPLDPVAILATGTKGRARQQLKLTLTPVAAPYSCLQAAVCAGGNLSVTTGDWTCSTAPVASNQNVVLSGSSTLDADVEAVGSITGSNYLASRTAGASARKLPDPATVFDYYVKNGTAIPFASIGGSKLDGALLSPSNNPYGATNALGIYVINCSGNKVDISNTRIVGTLVLLNVKTGSTVSGGVNLAPVIAGYPALMVQGSIGINFNDGGLTEGAGRNYNPPGTPYNGVSNATTTDTFPSSITGLVYVSGNASLSSNKVFNGSVIIAGTLSSDDAVTITYDPTVASSPPPGFCDPPQMKVLTSSWKQVVQ